MKFVPEFEDRDPDDMIDPIMLHMRDMLTADTPDMGFVGYFKFIDRVLSNPASDALLYEIRRHSAGANEYCFIRFLIGEDEMYTVTFRRRPGQGWRFWYSSDGWGNKARTVKHAMTDLGCK